MLFKKVMICSFLFVIASFGAFEAWAFFGLFSSKPPLEVPLVRPDIDTNKNGINDIEELIAGAKQEVANRPWYKSAYYKGGYPPENEGVCTDLIWRAYAHAGYNLKNLVDADIGNNTKQYPRINGKPDPNIDFRRILNLVVYFKRFAQILPTTIVPNDVENLKLWQPGDIVVFPKPQHIVILSTKRNSEGVPLMLHNPGPWAMETDDFMEWYERGITAHFRLK